MLQVIERLLCKLGMHEGYLNGTDMIYKCKRCGEVTLIVYMDDYK